MGIHNAILVLAMFSSLVALAQGQGTRVGFYSRSCPRAESIVQSTMRTHFQSNPTIAPGILRMHFHDCFVEGCDASILIDGPATEKTAGPNLNLRGFEVIEDAKRQIEAVCPGVVSCADILNFAARDSVVLSGGASWAVPAGRRDGRVSQASATVNLPGFRDSVTVQKEKFIQKDNLTTDDLVTLVGAHTIGTSACRLFSYRLYNFTNGGPDPTIDATFLPTLRQLCPDGGDGARRVGMDLGSETRFDTAYFGKLRDGRGVLESDQRLWGDASTRAVVQRFLAGNGRGFNAQFGRAMVKLSNVGVKVGANGEIRRVCSAVN